MAGKKNVLIIIDENQIAALKKNTIYQAFERMGFYDKNFLMENDIKVVQFSATPDQCLADIKYWGPHSASFRLSGGVGYRSCFELNSAGRVKQYRDISEQDDSGGGKPTENAESAITELYECIERTFSQPMNHIIRGVNSDKQEKIKMNLKSILKKKLGFKYDLVYCNSDSGITNINKLLITAD